MGFANIIALVYVTLLRPNKLSKQIVLYMIVLFHKYK